MLRVILEDKALTVQEVITQASESNLLGRSVRLDALCTLGNGKKVNYISEHDFIKGKKTTYHMDHVLRETGKVIQNGLEVIFVNTEIFDGTEIAELMQCFMQKTVENPKFPAFSHEVKQLKETEGGKHTMSDVLLNIMERERAEARAEGRAEGRDNMAEDMRALGIPEEKIQEAIRRNRERLAN